MKKAVLFILMAVSALGVTAQTWSVDKEHSKLGFSITHLMISNVEGSFRVFDAKIVSEREDFSDAVVELTADIASIDTDNEMRDDHLKSPDYFDAAKFSQAVFKSTSFRKVVDRKYKLGGNLTMHGVTKFVELDVTFNGTTVHPYTKKTVAGFKVSGTIRRTDFNIAPSTPGAALSDEVTIETNAEFVRQ